MPILLLCPGCSSPSFEKIPGIREEVDQNDVPIPRDFVRIEKKSWEYIQFDRGPGRFRSWKAEYVGDKQPRDLVPWYVDQMIRDGWLHKGTIDGPKRILTFTKKENQELAEITIFSDYNPRQDRFQTILQAEIRPLKLAEMGIEEVLEPEEPAKALPAAAVGVPPASAPLPTIKSAKAIPAAKRGSLAPVRAQPGQAGAAANPAAGEEEGSGKEDGTTEP
ncbi:MAG: hypothetical protein HY717_04775 [Planctomycetes bacterium]|nr:hypothetical protein [Planctomycetota bacterium]